MTWIQELLNGSDDHRATSDLGGAIFAPVDGSDDALVRFQKVANQILANDGLGYTVVNRLIHRSRDHATSPIDRIVVNIPH
jgi:hypothetical protein